jgi:uncharacterized protein
MGMLTKETIENKLKEPMRNKDETGKRTYRMILSAVKLAEVEKRDALDEPGLLAVLQKEVKTHKESIADAEKAGRPDLAEAAKTELDLITAFLPAPLSPEELEGIIRDAIRESGAESPKEMGKVMKLVAPKTQGRADNREVSQLVRKLLGG